MSLLTANGIPVAEAYLSLPRVGRGVASVILGRDTGPSGGESVTLEWQDGTTLACTCVVGQKAQGWWQMGLVLGAGKLSRGLPSRYYEGIPAATVAKDIVSEAGEKAGQIDLPGTLTRYVRREGPAYQQLSALLAGTDRAWRIQPDGKVWIGLDGYPQEGPVDVVKAHPQTRRYTLGLSPDLQPGVSLLGRLDGEERPLGKVDRVAHRVGKELRTEVWCAD
ncbi:MAG: hypothetical protein RMN24_09325 [Anaerolineae bacterium]|nr:hypothetical protein [Anaerolineae bacterium]